MELGETFLQLGIAVGLGLLVGLQRERTVSSLAGFRTFPLVTSLGTLCGLLAEEFGGGVIVAGLIAITGMIVMGNYAKWKRGEIDPGLTTEIALLVMFGVGAYLVIGQRAVAITVGGGVAVLLHLKPQLHALAARIGEKDFKAVMQFVLVTLVILPVLPNESYGPFAVFNPHRIWLMVVLIVGISLGGYVAYKFFGAKTGAVLAGMLGGLISSTATTVSYARRTRETSAGAGLAAFVIMVASAVVFGRVLALIAVAAPQSFAEFALPITTLFGVSAVVTGGMWFRARREAVKMPEHTNPTELKSAIYFGALFTVVLFATAAAREWFGIQGLYVVAVFSGLTDMDAITLSTAQMVNGGQIAGSTGWRLVVAGAMANLVFKAGVALALGNGGLFRRIAMSFTLIFAAGVAMLAFWPG